MASWNNEYDPDQLARKIESNKVVSDSGVVSFQGFIHAEYVALLYSMLKFSDSLPEVQARRMVNQAVSKAGEKGKITSSVLLQEINKLENEYFKRTPSRYVLVTSISADFPLTKKIYFNGTILIFSKELSEAFDLARANLIAQQIYILHSKVPDNYLTTRIYVSARSIDEAAEKALNTLDLVRGIWNLFYNRQHSFRMSFGSQEPVNKIVLGPVHTLHNLNGDLAAKFFWYEPRYNEAQKVHNISEDVDKLKRFFTVVRKKLDKCRYREALENVIIQYTRALDERDWDIAFLKLWSILETITDKEESYKVTIRRASFVFDDHLYYQQVLRHLKDYRNRFVHEATNSTENETYMYQLKNLVEALIGFHLGNKFGFSSIKEACEFLDLPTEKDILNERVKIIRNAQKYLKYV